MKQTLWQFLELCLLLALVAACNNQTSRNFTAYARLKHSFSNKPPSSGQVRSTANEPTLDDIALIQREVSTTTLHLPYIARVGQTIITHLYPSGGRTLWYWGREYISYLTRDRKFAFFYGLLMIGLAAALIIQWLRIKGMGGDN